MQKHLKFFGLIVFSTFIQNSEFPALQNIKQITFCSMGFEKAGEEYFNSDASKIIFQASELKYASPAFSKTMEQNVICLIF